MSSIKLNSLQENISVFFIKLRTKEQMGTFVQLATFNASKPKIRITIYFTLNLPLILSTIFHSMSNILIQIILLASSCRSDKCVLEVKRIGKMFSLFWYLYEEWQGKSKVKSKYINMSLDVLNDAHPNKKKILQVLVVCKQRPSFFI